MLPNDTQLLPHIAAVLREAIEVTLPTPDEFLKVKETLTRCGIASRKDPDHPKLYQSCHILHKRGKYYICHFLELFLLDGKEAQTKFTEDDRARRNTIANMLAEWKLVILCDPAKSMSPAVPASAITVISFHDKKNWELCAKYQVGKKLFGGVNDITGTSHH
jgi:hypothetical protein